jgi:signal transduction histidine kinase/predicted ATPase
MFACAEWELAVLERIASPRVIVSGNVSGHRRLSSLLSPESLFAPVEVVELSLAIAEALACAHRVSIAHRSLEARSVWVAPDLKDSKLEGFGDARVLTRESELLDLRALGVLFHQLASGAAPQKHGRLPPALKALRSELPQVYSDIVLLLLAPVSSDSYRSIESTVADLHSCRELLAANKANARIPLNTLRGANDSGEDLVGRTEATKTILEAYASTLSGQRCFVEIAGVSGIGKTSLVRQIRPRLEAGGAHLSAGKFDDLHRSRVHGALAEAIRAASFALLQRQGAEVLGQKLGDARGWILRVIPELASLLGGEPASVKVSDAEAQARISSAIVEYVAELGALVGPIAFFLDDLQWSDRATLEVLPRLILETDPKRVFFLLAWRSEEVDPAHPVSIMRDELAQAGARAAHVSLQPLSREDICSLCERSVGAERAAELAPSLHESSGGNPLFARELLRMWMREGAIAQDASPVRSDRMLAEGLLRFTSKTRRALAFAAMIGPEIRLADLATVLKISAEVLELDLGPAVRDGVLLELSAERAYRFSHDRLEAASRTFLELDAAAAHAEIAELFAADWKSADPARLHWLAAQARAGVSKLRNSEAAPSLCSMLLEAAAGARASAAFGTAVVDLLAALALRGEHSERALVLELAACAVAQGDVDNAQRAARRLETIAERPEDRARAKLVDVEMQALLHAHGNAIDAAIEGLSLLGISLMRKPPRWKVGAGIVAMQLKLMRRTPEEIAALPSMEDERPRLALALLTSMMGSVYQSGDNDLFAMCALSAARLALEHGHADGTGFAFVVYGMLRVIAFRDLNGARKWARLGLAISERYDAPGTRCKAQVVYQQFVHPWTEDRLVEREEVLRAHALGRDGGELTYAGYAFGTVLTSFAKGPQLAETEALATIGLAFVARTGDPGTTIFTRALIDFYRQLRNGETLVPTRVLGEEAYAALGASWRLWWQGHRALVALLTEDRVQLDEAVQAGEIDQEAGNASWMWCVYRFAAAMRVAMRIGEGRSTHRERAQLKDVLDFFRKWQRVCPKQASAYLYLLQGELARARNRREAADLLARAVEAATCAEQHPIAILAAKRAAEEHRDLGASHLAHAFEVLASEAALAWNAPALAPARTKRVPQIAGVPQEPLFQALELLARESDPQRLAEAVLSQSAVLASADRATLYLRRAGAWRAVAGARSLQPSILSAALLSAETHVFADPEDRSSKLCLVPLWRTSEVVGALLLEGKQLDASATPALAVIASSIAVLLENVHLQRELSAALSDARSAEKVKAVLLANVSHELRTPLHGILGTVEHLEAEPLSARARELAGELGSAALGLRRSLGALLEYVDAESGELALEHVAFDLLHLIESTVVPHRARAEGKGLELLVLFLTDLPRGVKGDPIRVARVLDQVLDNAVKFTAEGSISITVDQTPRDDGRFELSFSIADTGSGMSEDERARAFDLLHQQDSSSTKAHAGLGMGLPFVRRAMRVLEGRVSIASQRGQGTRVELALPLVAFDPVIEEVVPSTEVDVARRLVLVAEDNLVNQKLMSRTLDRLGYAHLVCEDGEKVTRAYRERAAEVLCVLMDCQMPVMDGYEATVEIRAVEAARKLPRTPIIAVTANAMAQDREKCLKSGMDEHLPKPVRSAELQAVLERFVGLSRDGLNDPRYPAARIGGSELQVAG